MPEPLRVFHYVFETHIRLLITTQREDLQMIFGIADLHQPVLNEQTGLPVCKSCGIWMCSTYRIIVEELIAMGLAPQTALTYSSLGSAGGGVDLGKGQPGQPSTKQETARSGCPHVPRQLIRMD